MKVIYDKANELLDEILKKTVSFEKKEASVIPTVDNEWPGHALICGPSGSGKSTYLSNYLMEFRKVYKGCPIYVFSTIDDDPAFKKLNVTYIKIDDDIIDHPFTLEEFKGTSKQPSLLVFDDIEIHSNKHIAESIQTFLNLVLETGRHFHMCAFVVAHQILNFNKSRKVLNEASRVTVFPNTNFNSIANYLRRYLGFMKDDINTIKNLGKTSRWVTISRCYPTLCIWEHGVKIF